MGLDMYLNKRPKVNNNSELSEAVCHFVKWIRSDYNCTFSQWCGQHYSDLPDMKTMIAILDKYPKDSFGKEVGYWRKANQIHRWFVENVQDGVDDCDIHRAVTKKDLETLKRLCQVVLTDHSLAEKLLPSMPGFFFGTYDYNEYYFQDLENTVKICDKILKDTDFDDYEIYYRSSW